MRPDWSVLQGASELLQHLLLSLVPLLLDRAFLSALLLQQMLLLHAFLMSVNTQLRVVVVVAAAVWQTVSPAAAAAVP